MKYVTKLFPNLLNYFSKRIYIHIYKRVFVFLFASVGSRVCVYVYFSIYVFIYKRVVSGAVSLRITVSNDVTVEYFKLSYIHRMPGCMLTTQTPHLHLKMSETFETTWTNQQQFIHNVCVCDCMCVHLLLHTARI